MFKVKLRFVDGSSLDYDSQGNEEPNKIRYSLEKNEPLIVLEGNKTMMIVPQNILFVDITEAQEQPKSSSKGTGFLIRCVECGKVSTIKSKDEGRNVCYECVPQK